MYFCGICDDLDFTTKGRCLRHLWEQHAGLQYKCLKCRKLFRRNDNRLLIGSMWWITLQERGHNLPCRITVNVRGCPLLQYLLGLHLLHPARHLHPIHQILQHPQHLPHLPLHLSRLRLRQSSVKMRRN